MIKYLFIVFWLICGSVNADNRREQLLRIINEELNEVSRLNKQIGSKKPDILLRMAELYLEKARLIREEENRRFLSIDPNKRRRAKKSDFYQESTKNFKNAQKTCYYLLKRFPNYKRKGYVYFVLAYNAKEFQQINKAKSFFEKAIGSSSPNSEINRKSKLALAEIYFNMYRYQQAIPLYEAALKLKKDKWWTKDSYNLAWCYFRTGKKYKAISLMKEANRLSSDPNYIDLRESIQRDLAYFYADMGKVNEAVGFYKANNRDVAKSLHGVGKHLMSKGKNKEADSALQKAFASANDDRQRLAIDITLLTLYEDLLDYPNHHKVTKRMFGYYQKGMLDKDQVENLNYHVKKMSASLQKQVAAKTYVRLPEVRKGKADLAVSYFSMLETLTPDKKYISQFHSGETSYAVGDFDKAIERYDLAYKGARAANDRKIAGVALNGLLASLGKRGISQQTKDTYLISSFEYYLEVNPSDKRAFRIYQRLFTAYMEKGEIANAERLVYRFKKYFPNEDKKSEAMIAQIIDHYNESKDKNNIKAWVGRINRGDFKVSKKFAEKVNLLLLSLQFENVQKFSSKGDKVQALRGFHQIYKSGDSTAQAKRNAAYNIAILYYELGDAKNLSQWSNQSLQLMTSKEIVKFEDSFQLFGEELFLQNKTKMGANLYYSTLNKVCKWKSKNKNAFAKNAIVLYLTDGMINEAIQVYERMDRCGISSKIKRESGIDIIKELVKQKRWDSTLNIAKGLENDPKAVPHLIVPYYRVSRAYKAIGREKRSINLDQKIWALYKRIEKRGEKLPLDALDILVEVKLNTLEKYEDRLNKVKLSFPEKRFNSRLKAKFKNLDDIVSKAVEIFKMGSGKGIVSTYQLLIRTHTSVASEIDSFTPEGKSAEYITSFKSQMSSLVGPLMQKAEQYRREAVKKVYNEEILTEENYKLFNIYNPELPLQYLPLKTGILMDKGGKR